MNESWGHYSKWNEKVTQKQILYDFIYIKYIETGSGMVVAKGGEREKWRVLVLQDKKNSGDWLVAQQFECT